MNPLLVAGAPARDGAEFGKRVEAAMFAENLSMSRESYIRQLAHQARARAEQEANTHRWQHHEEKVLRSRGFWSPICSCGDFGLCDWCAYLADRDNGPWVLYG